MLSVAPVAAVLAAVSLALAAAGTGWAAVATWSLSAVILAEEAAGSRRALGAGFGREVPARLLLLTAATVGAVRHSPDDRGWIWAIAAVLLVGVVLEPLPLRAVRRVRAVHALPGYRPPPGAAAVPLFVWASFVELLAAGALGVAKAPLVLRFALLGVAVAIDAVIVTIAALTWRDRTAARRRLRRALEEYAPQFVLYNGREDGGAYQLAMWLPYLERLGLPFVVVVRGQAALEAVTSVTSAPIVSPISLRDLDDVVVGSIRAAFYPSSAANNAHLVAYRSVRHVYLGHGDSDKAMSPHPMHAMYDHVFVAGQAAIDRYRRNGVHIRPSAYMVIGRPQLEVIHVAHGPVPARPTVLYAPTWAGHNTAGTHSSLPQGQNLVRALLQQDVVILFRPHPISRRIPAERARAAAIDELLRQDSARTGRIHRFGPAVDGTSFADSANVCDMMLADMSSIMVDFLGSQKPMAVNVRGVETSEEFLAHYPAARGAYLVAADGANLAEVISAMRGDDPQRTARQATAEYYLGGLDGAGAVTAFLDAAGQCIRGERTPERAGPPS